MALHWEKGAIYDGDWRLIAHEPELNRTVWMIQDKMTGEVTLRCDYDVTKTIEQNKELYNEADKGWKGDYMHRIASIPPNVFYDQIEPLKGDDKAISRWLNDPDNRHFRVKPGHI